MIFIRWRNQYRPAAIHIQTPLCYIKHMGAPVGHIAATEFLVVAPMCPKVIIQTGRQVMVEGRFFYIRPQPEFPIEAGWNWFCRKIVRLWRWPDIDDNVFNLPDVSITH